MRAALVREVGRREAGLPVVAVDQVRAPAVEMAEAASESLMDDDLEIPAFLRHRAN